MKKSNFKFSVLVKIVRKLALVSIFSMMIVFNLTAQQYNVVSSGGQAIETPPGSGCYKLTDACSQGSAIWNIYKIDLSQPFDITLTLNFGNRPNIYWDNCINCGGDGMTFCLQPLSNSTYYLGGSMGEDPALTPSVFVQMDTYTANPTDPNYEHISINKNGDVLHGTTNELTPYTAAQNWPCTAAMTTCVSDGQDHLFHFVWTPAASGSGPGTLKAYFGFNGTLPPQPTITYTGDIVTNIFGGDPNVYWGVTAATGGCYNVQTVCMTTISNFSSDTTICVGQPLIFTDNSISGQTITVWSWDFGDNTYDYTQFPAPHVYTAPGVYQANLYIQNQGGFSATMTHAITVKPRPDIKVNDTSICKGDTAVLTASGGNTYKWMDMLNDTLSSVNPYKVSPGVTTQYIVVGKNTLGCINTDTATVTIYPNPVPVINTTSYVICNGQSTTLNASGADTYLWSPSMDTTSSITVSPTVTTEYFLEGTTINGCKKDTNILIQVNPNPIISATGDVICLNANATISATGAATYAWSTNGTDVSTSNPFTVSPLTTTTYTVVGTDVNNCTDTTTATIVVNMPPVISVDSVGICQGYEGALTVVGGNNNLTYYWVNTGTTFNPLQASPAITTLYTVIATDPNGCQDTAWANIVVHPKPIAAFTPNPTLVNTDIPDVNFSDQSTFATIWAWDFGDPTSAANNSSIIESPTHPYTAPGTYTIWLRVASDFGCQDSISHKIVAQSPIEFYLPNAFDPTSNNSDINVFKPKGKGIDYQNYQLVIFDRWGKELFSTTDFNEGWNGKYNNVGDVLQHGVYVYYIRYKELWGTYRERTGSVTMVR